MSGWRPGGSEIYEWSTGWVQGIHDYMTSQEYR